MKWRIISLGLSILLVLLFLWSEQQAKAVLCTQLNVVIEDSLQIRFLTPTRVEAFMLKGMSDPRGTKLEGVNTAKIEELLQRNSCVRSAQVYADCRGWLTVRILQREPFFRIIAASGNSCYVDRMGLCMGLSDNYTARTVVVNGRISLPGESDLRFQRDPDPVQLLLNDSLLLNHDDGMDARDGWMQFWRKFYDFMLYVDSDPFWRAQFAQVWIENQQSIELIPRVGGHTVLLGSLDDYEYKLNKLWSLYRAGLPGKGLNAYSLLDLRFANQVVCRKN